ncbi:MAG: UDP-N-acetylmuramate dehydrogenase [Patescibacteria group bacterium]
MIFNNKSQDKEKVPVTSYGIKIEQNILLKPFTTFKVGGNADYFCRVSSVDELKEAVSFSRENNIPIFVLGGGSNILVSDNGFKGLVIKIEINGMSFKEDGDSVLISAFAGEDWDNVVELSVKKQLYGIENLSFIPGTVGASVVQNIGAYGTEIKNVVTSVEVFDTQNLKIIVLKKTECEFGYRDSIFKKPRGGNYIVTKVCFRLKKERKLNLSYKDIKKHFDTYTDIPTLKEVRKAIGIIRKNKFPNPKMFGTVGSFFKNPIVLNEEASRLKNEIPDIYMFTVDNCNKKISIAWILDNELGLKGFKKGNICLFENQPLVVVNLGGANAREIKNFTDNIAEKIYKKIKIKIIPEVVFVGKF